MTSMQHWHDHDTVTMIMMTTTTSTHHRPHTRPHTSTCLNIVVVTLCSISTYINNISIHSLKATSPRTCVNARQPDHDWPGFGQDHNHSSVATGVSPVWLPVFLLVHNWTLKHYSRLQMHLHGAASWTPWSHTTPSQLLLLLSTLLASHRWHSVWTRWPLCSTFQISM